MFMKYVSEQKFRNPITKNPQTKTQKICKIWSFLHVDRLNLKIHSLSPRDQLTQLIRL